MGFRGSGIYSDARWLAVVNHSGTDVGHMAMDLDAVNSKGDVGYVFIARPGRAQCGLYRALEQRSISLAGSGFYDHSHAYGDIHGAGRFRVGTRRQLGLRRWVDGSADADFDHLSIHERVINRSKSEDTVIKHCRS